MTTRIVRVGNTLTVEIPEEMAAHISVSDGDLVEWTVDEAGRPQLGKRITREDLFQVDGPDAGRYTPAG
jgi:antitoxin component of MazEF toxin-antitoxin module